MSFPRYVFPIFQMQRAFDLTEFLSSLNRLVNITSLAEGPKHGEWSVNVVPSSAFTEEWAAQTRRSTTTLPGEPFLP